MEASRGSHISRTARTMAHPKWGSAIYALALLISLSTWFIVIRAPLWLDETVSLFLIKGGFAGIMSRRLARCSGILVPALAVDESHGHG